MRDAFVSVRRSEDGKKGSGRACFVCKEPTQVGKYNSLWIWFQIAEDAEVALTIVVRSGGQGTVEGNVLKLEACEEDKQDLYRLQQAIVNARGISDQILRRALSHTSKPKPGGEEPK